jgi:5-methylcytosine-specific restriction endonuclease McrA
MCNSAAHNSRPGRESLSKRLGAATTRALRARDGGRCVYCNVTEKGSGTQLQLDHVEPKSLGGDDSPLNLVYACRRCNSARQNLSLAEWRRYAAVKYGISFETRTVRAQARRKLVDPKTGRAIAA